MNNKRKINEIIDINKIDKSFLNYLDAISANSANNKDEEQISNQNDDIEDDEEFDIFGNENFKEDPTYNAVLILRQDMSSNDPQIIKDLITIAKAHFAITNLYTNNLYEPDWDNSKIYKFSKLLSIYNESFNYLEKNIKDIQWNYAKNKNRFFNIYDNIIKDDLTTFNLTKIRHENYRRYRTNRKSICLQLANIIGCKDTDGKDYIALFKYFNDKCSKIHLKDLYNWLKPQINKIFDDIKIQFISESLYNYNDIRAVFNIYCKTRKFAYKIFNMITSRSKYNGWEKWNKSFTSYCNADLSDSILRKLYNAANTEESFEEVDDFQQTSDEMSWSQQGIYESLDNKIINETWWDDDLDYYKSRQADRYAKNKIKNINMVATNANACKVTTDGKYVYSSVSFYPGDIIEICPTKVINKSALYSKDMRDIVFEVIPNKEWVLPFGYCQYYDTEINSNQNANCDFLWDPINRVIVIKALDKIPKFSKLILKHIK